MEKVFVNVRCLHSSPFSINITSMVTLSELKDAIKTTFGDAVPAAGFIELYDNSNKHITNLRDIEGSYCKEGGAVLDVRIKSRLSGPPFSAIQDDDVKQVLESFWKSLPSLTPEKDILTFTNIPPFFPKNMKSLLIRQSYADLFQLILYNLRNSNCWLRFHRMVITGNPGIGKSIFLFYVLWKISTMSKDEVGTVILRRGKDRGLIYVFEENRCWTTFSPADIVRFLFRTNTWYLTDTLDPPPGEVKAVTILVASPDRKHYKEVIKYSATDKLRYLPVWSLEELKQAAHLFNMTEDAVEERYRLIGGIARFVLEKSSEDLTSNIAASLGRLDIEKFYRIAEGLVNDESGISHLIVHFVVNSKFEMVSIQFSSIYVTDMALDLLSKRQHQKLCEFLVSDEPIATVSSLRDNLFEAFSHRALSSGGTFECRCLEDGEKSTLTLDELKMDRFTDIAKCEGDKYFVPWHPNYPCIDAFIRDCGLFQMTVSEDHPINKATMMEIVDATKMRKLFFVVPQHLFHNFKKQRMDEKKEKAGPTKKKNEPVVIPVVSQYVIGIDIQSSINRN